MKLLNVPPRCRGLPFSLPRLVIAVIVICACSGAEAVKTLVVVGGGPAGFFGGIHAAHRGSEDLRVVVLEQGRSALQKVKISGGGRCNVQHDPNKAVSVIAQGYPRGSVQLLGPLTGRFGPAQTAQWFESRGVRLKTEEDGRVFPVTDDSQTIINCLAEALRLSGAILLTDARVLNIAAVAAITATAGAAVTAATSDATGAAAADAADGAAPTPTLQQHAASPEEAGAEAPSVRPSGSAATAPSGFMVRLSCPQPPPAYLLAAKRTAPCSKRMQFDISCDYVLLATGSSRDGYDWARRLGHVVAPPVPSLFTFNLGRSGGKYGGGGDIGGHGGGGILEGLAGVSLPDVELTLQLETAMPAKAKAAAVAAAEAATGKDAPKSADKPAAAAAAEKPKGRRRPGAQALTQRGPLLVTHTGISGPAALKLSAWAARELHDVGYRGKVNLNCLPGANAAAVLQRLERERRALARRAITAFCPLQDAGIPKRLWQALCDSAGIGREERWADASNAKLRAVAERICALELEVVSKGAFKEEFVTCGGVSLAEIDMRTMCSRVVPGLFFAGEVMDIDGVTGGYNLQSAWTTGFVAGCGVAAAAAAAASAGAAVGAGGQTENGV